MSLLDSFGAVVSAQLADDLPVAVLRLAQAPGTLCSRYNASSSSSSTSSTSRPSCLTVPAAAPGDYVVDLSGLTVMPLKYGIAAFSGLRLLAPPGSEIPVKVTLSGSNISVAPLDLTILVKPCGAGQLRNGTGDCIQCPIPQYTLSAEDNMCRPCPLRMQCLGAAPVPQDGIYQPHPYSTVAVPCRNRAACAYSGRDMALADFQQQLQGISAPSQLSLREYNNLQCAVGYSGAGCSKCDRMAGYGMSANHRCHKCPPRFLSWVAFLLARCLDLLLVLGIVMAWWYGGPLAREIVAAGSSGQQEDEDASTSSHDKVDDSMDSASSLVSKQAAKAHWQVPLAQKLLLANAVLLLPVRINFKHTTRAIVC